MTRSIITVIRDPHNTLGKKVRIDANGDISTGAGVVVTTALAVMREVANHDDMADLLREVGNDPHAAIIPDAFVGLEVGQEFAILPEQIIKSRLGVTSRREAAGVHTLEVEGRLLPTVGRLKENILPGAWRLLDRDVDAFTPQEFAGMDFSQWLTAVDKLLPGVAAASYVRAESTSSRVLRDGVPIKSGNGHVWVKLENPDDGERTRQAILVRAIEHGLHWQKPKFSRTSGEQVGSSPTTIVDPSVWTPGRLVFVGRPVVGRGLEVAPPAVEVFHGVEPTLWTVHAALPSPEKVRELTKAAGGELVVTSDGTGIKFSAFDLRLDTVLETPNGVTTVACAMEARQVLRCQTPFRESDSMAGKLNYGNDGRPFVHDVGTGITHWLTSEDWQPIVDQETGECFEVVSEDEGAPAAAKAPVVTLDTLRADLKGLVDAGGAPDAIAAKMVRKIIKAKFNSVQEELALKDLKRATGLSLGTLRKTMQDARAEGADEDEGLGGNTHADYATRLLVSIAKDSKGQAPVGVEGNIYVVGPDNVWRGKLAADYEVEVGREFSGLDHCHRRSDYTGIANHAYAIAAQGNAEFFADAPVGMACPDGMFYRLGEGGELKIEKLTAAHCQRFVVGAVPRPMLTPLFNRFLSETFASDLEGDEQEQTALLQEIMGASMLGIMARYEKVVFLYGEGRAGKGTVLKIMEELVPREWRAAVTPFKWDSEYYIASLAGKRLNLVGELPQSQPIPAAEFKTVTGRDQLTGRHPTGRPFLFRCEAAHIFNSNHLINTSDHSDAFFSRWLTLEFRNSRVSAGPGSIDVDLAAKMISAELPGILWWALQGARRLVARGYFKTSRTHESLMARWRRRTDSLLEFLHDGDACQFAEPQRYVRRSDVWEAYKDWCAVSGRHAVGKQKFFEMLDTPKVRALGVTVKRHKEHRDVVCGIQLADKSGFDAGMGEFAMNCTFDMPRIEDLV